MNETSILYIDDDPGIRRLVSRALSRRGYKVTCAEGGAEGVALASAEQFDLIAVDHYMPGLDGIATLERLQAQADVPPIVYVTGSDEGRIAVAALKAGAADYVIKTVGEEFFDLLAAACRNVRAKADAEGQLRAANARLEALLGEVNHRVANSLQLVSSMVGMQAAALSDPAARAALEDTQARIRAIGQVHRRLYTGSDVTGVDMPEYLRALIGELEETWSTDSAPRSLSLRAEPISLATDRAVSLGVIVTELVTNACKYAYPHGPGEVRVALTRAGEDAFTLAVEDDGCGMTAGTDPRGTGLGTRLIRAMAQSLQSVVEYDAGHRGCRAVLTAPIG